MNIGTILVCLFTSNASVALPPPGAVITGKVKGAENQPLPGVNVSLFRLPDSVIVAVAQTDGKGAYQFREVAAGRYFLQASAVGMKKANAAPFSINADDPTFLLPDIRMVEEVGSLREVTVIGRKKALDVTEGKMVYNIDQRIAAAGNSAFDLLQRTPGVSVTGEDNLLLKGNSNVNVMLDGKMTYLSPQQLSSLLKSTPAENLARIEVITAPGSQYDAAGNAGIINIVTKKSSRRGYALDVSTGVGTGRYLQTSETMTGNVKTKRFNVFGNYAYSYKHAYLDRTSYRVIKLGEETTIYDRSSFDPSKWNSHSYRAGVEFYAGKSQEIGFIYSGFSNVWSRTGNGPTRIINPNNATGEVVQNQNLTREPAVNNAMNINYKARLDTTGQQVTVDADYSGYVNDSRGSLGNRQFSDTGTPLQPYQELAFTQPSRITIHSLKSDLLFPLKANRLAAGLKYSYVTADNNFRYDSLINNQYVFSSVLSNHFIYQERIYAAYASVGRQFGKTSLDVGMRVEKTLSEGNSITLNRITRRSYTNLFPNVSVGRQFNEQHRLNFSLTRRINRPAYGNLNPARYFFDKFSYYEGNPFLQPETSWNVATAYTYRSTYVVTLGFIRTSNPISGLAQQNNQTGELVVSTANFSHREDYDALFVIPVQPTDFWKIQNILDIRYLTYAFVQGNTVFKPGKFTVDVSSIQTIKLPGSSTLELSAHYTSSSLDGVYVLKPFFSVDGGWKKSFANKKLDFKLSFTDLFKTIHYWGYSVYEGADVRYNHTGDTRRVNISLSWHLGGKLTPGKARKLEEEERVN